MTKKRPREKRDVNIQLVEIFEDLASESEEVRLKAATLLLARENLSRDDVLETLRRLIRGLCSGRKAARPGFSIALTEFLAIYASEEAVARNLPQLSSLEVVLQLREQTQTKESGQEERNHLLGRLFAAAAVINSRIIFRPQYAGPYSQILDLVFELAQKKSWLREECGWVLFKALQVFEELRDGATYAQAVIDRLHANGLCKTIEGIALWIAALERFPSLQWPEAVFRHNDPLDREERPMLARVLKGTASESHSDDIHSKNGQSGAWSSKLNFAWDVILTSSLKGNGGRVSFSKLWPEIVDDGMFALAASEERKHQGFLLVQTHLATLPADQISVVFGKNFMRCLVNQNKAESRYLHQMAARTLKAIQNRARSEPQAAVSIIEGVVGSREYVNFDKKTHTKTLATMIGEVPVQNLKGVVDVFAAVMIRPGVEEAKPASAKRLALADHLLSVVRSLNITDTVDRDAYRSAVTHILELFAQLACSDSYSDHHGAVKQCVPGVSTSSRQVFRSRLLSCLNHLIAKDTEASHHAYNVANLLQSQSREDMDLNFKADEHVRYIVDGAWIALERIHAKKVSRSHEDAATYHAMELLFSITILQAYFGEADAVSILQDLEGSVDSLLSTKSTRQQVDGSLSLIEIILSLISKPSSLFRRLAQQVFPICCSSVGKEGLSSMISILQAKENAQGQNELFEDAAEAEDIEIGEGDASDVDEVGSESSSETSISGEDSAESRSGEANPEMGDGDDEAAELERKLAEALGTRRADADAAVAESESSEEDMDDEQMEALDSSIANIFRERSKLKSKKKEAQEAKQNIVQFKCRVLELLEIYVKRQFSDPTSLTLLCPLLDTIRETSDKQVSHKGCELVRTFMKAYKFDAHKTSDEKAMTAARDFLPKVHDLVTLEGSNAYVSACSQASLLLVKVLVSNGGTIPEAWEQYSRTGEKVATSPRCKVLGPLLQDWVGWLINVNASNGLQKIKQ